MRKLQWIICGHTEKRENISSFDWGAIYSTLDGSFDLFLCPICCCRGRMCIIKIYFWKIILCHYGLTANDSICFSFDNFLLLFLWADIISHYISLLLFHSIPSQSVLCYPLSNEQTFSIVLHSHVWMYECMNAISRMNMSVSEEEHDNKFQNYSWIDFNKFLLAILLILARALGMNSKSILQPSFRFHGVFNYFSHYDNIIITCLNLDIFSYMLIMILRSSHFIKLPPKLLRIAVIYITMRGDESW
jgi:hypothetical protein